MNCEVQVHALMYVPRVNVFQVTATCTFSNSKDKTYPTASFTGTGTTDSSGVFLAYLASGTYPYNSLGIDYSYVNYVFKNGKFDEGILPEVEIVGCKIDFISGGSPSGCSVLTYNSGSCSGGNVSTLHKHLHI